MAMAAEGEEGSKAETTTDINAGSSDVETQLNACCVELRRIRMEQEKSEPNKAGSKALAVCLQQLAKLPVNKALLLKTHVGCELNQAWIRRHSDKKVCKVSQALIDSWKAATGVQKKKNRKPEKSHKQASEDLEEPSSSNKAKWTSSPEKGEKSHKRASKDLEESSSLKKARSTSSPDKVHAGKNAKLVSLFKELASFEFKQKAHFKGIAYNNVAKSLSEMDMDISLLQVTDVSRIGNAAMRQINEFMETGKIQTLEKYRRCNLEDPD